MLLVILLSALPFLNQPENIEPLTGLPWQIEILADGSTQVFGLEIGKSRLSDALAILGDDVELAIIAASDETGNLEMYYGHFKAGVISGKLVVSTKASEQNIKYWRERAIKSDYVATGRAKKYSLSSDDLTQALDEVIAGLTFIPAVNLDEEIILTRFGEPDERVQLDDAIHFLYSEKGLDIAFYENAKEVLQYVSPGDFRSYK
jgi:hypothetical protein